MDCLSIAHFTPPILYNAKTRTLDSTIIQDLELVQLIQIKKEDQVKDDQVKDDQVKDDEGKKEDKEKEDKPLYEYIFQPSTELGVASLNQMVSHYTTDVAYLNDFKNLIKSGNKSANKSANKSVKAHPLAQKDIPDSSTKQMLETWQKIKGETSFCEKYSFIQWDFAKALNSNPIFLQLMSVYNLASPIISLCSPLLLLIIPFFILKLKKIPISISEYCNILKGLMQSNPVAKIFTNFSSLDSGQQIYSLVSASFYIFTIYQNIMSCIKFYLNMQDIHSHLSNINNYLNFTLTKMRDFSERISHFVSFQAFKADLDTKIIQLHGWKLELDDISPFSFSLTSLKQFGKVLASFYKIHASEPIAEIVSYSFGFHGFTEIMDSLQSQLRSGSMHFASFPKRSQKRDETKTKTKTKTKFKGLFYPKFISDSAVIKNDCSLDKNMVITAPNGGGKTTLLKSVLINVLLCQQVGAGCFDRATFTPFTQFHCYLNIPDTSGRDSLFQAEARRCKTILDKINDESEGQSHLCIFDELYSGTNPEEAVDSATAFMNYLTHKLNVSCMLTTHYTQLCHNLQSNPKIINMHMGITCEPNKDSKQFQYTYKLAKGISTVKGGFKVLQDMNYPSEMLI